MDNRLIAEEIMKRSRAAQAQIAELDQASVKKMVKAVAYASFKGAEECCKLAIEETGKGNLASKIAKHAFSAKMIWAYLKKDSSKSVGVIEDLPEIGLQKVAKPAGVVVNLLPITAPTSTPSGNAIYALFARNSMVVCPHPGSKKSSVMICDMMRAALKEAGYPEDLIICVEEPNMQLSSELMSMANVVIATGGPSVVHAAYSSGKPSFGVGQGNAQTVLAPDYEDLDRFTTVVVASRTNDNGMPCISDQTLHIPEDKVDTVIDGLVSKGAYLMTAEETEKVEHTYFKPDGKIDGTCVGLSAAAIAEKAGFSIPEGKVLLLSKIDFWGEGHLLSREMMIPYCRILPYGDVKAAIERARENYLLEGAGHNGAVFTNDDEIAALAGERIPVTRLSINENPGYGAGCNVDNGMWPTNSLGCGFWGGNNLCGNLTYKELLNITHVCRRVPGVPFPTDEEIWAD